MNSRHFFTELHFCQSTPLAYMLLFVMATALMLKLFSEEALMYHGFGMFRKMI